jgi:uncharacterized protein (TIGR02284 family)
MTDKQTLQELRRLYRILEAGEKGYAVSAVNVNNRGLKVLFKSFAQQRTRFKSEILAEMRRLGGELRNQSDLLAGIHRGRINIFAALTIGKDERERVVLKEILIGERFALQAYKKALKKELHPDVLELISRQLVDIRQVVEQIKLMRGKEGKRLVVRLFDSENDADSAVLEMKNVGLHPEMIERQSFNEAVEIYKGKSTTVSETVISGAVGGAFWGGLIGLFAGLGMQVAGFTPLGTAVAQNIWAYLALAGLLAGQFVGSVLGFAIGVGLAGEDAYQYDISIQRGKILLMAMVDALRAPEAGQIMALVNLRAREKLEKATA